MNDVGIILREQLSDAEIDIAYDEEYDTVGIDRHILDLLEGIKDEARGGQTVSMKTLTKKLIIS